MPRSRGALLALLLPALALAQPTAPSPAQDPVNGGGRFVLDKDGRWVPAPEAPGGDQTIARAKSLLADNQPAQALALLDGWIKQRLVDPPAEMAEALLRRGDAKTALGDEFEALYDYERVARYYVASDQFVLALERELEISTRYLAGLRVKAWFGLRYESGIDVAEELLIRIQERMPGSQLAERAAIELADYYYRIRDLQMAGEAYDIFLRNFPRSEYRQRAELRRIFASIGQFKGPQYDAQPLREAQERVRRFAAQFPAEAEQTGVSDALATRLEESAAQQMLEVGKWYLRRDNEVSARLTLKRLLRAHPDTVAARRAEDLFREHRWELPKPKAAAPVTAPDAPAEGATK